MSRKGIASLIVNRSIAQHIMIQHGMNNTIAYSAYSVYYKESSLNEGRLPHCYALTII